MEKQQIINQIIADIASKTQVKSISPTDIANSLYNIIEYASQQGVVTSGNGSPDINITEPFGRWYHDIANQKLYVKIEQQWQTLIDLDSISSNYGANIEKAVSQKFFTDELTEIKTQIGNIKPKTEDRPSQRTIRDLEGAKNGDNITYKTYSAFVLDSTAVYLNGQRLFAGKGYIEKDDTTIEFTSYTPLETDELVIEAIFSG